MVIKLPLE